MKIIKIAPNDKGGHANNACDSGTLPVPGGWAVIPDDMPIPDTFPFVNIMVDDSTPPVVTSMTAGVRPPPEPEPEPEPTEIEALRAEVTSLSMTAGIAFVALAEAGDIDDVTAGEHAELFSPWAANVRYKTGNIRSFGGRLFRCVQDHTSQEDWAPDKAASLWALIADPAQEWPAWSQPIGAHDAYNAGDKVSHGGKRWVSDLDGNAYEPGIYGWSETK